MVEAIIGLIIIFIFVLTVTILSSGTRHDDTMSKALKEKRQKRQVKKVIERKVLDTDTAELLHDWHDISQTYVFGISEEHLYRTEGEYFVHLINKNSGYEDIMVVTKSEAIEWLESHGGADILLERFSEDLEQA